jgi:hypothetical protein
MRKKKGSAVDTAALTSAWEKVFTSMAVDDLDDYKAKGWMSADCFATQAGVTLDSARCMLRRMAQSNKVETKKIRAMVGKVIREISIYRPQS